MQMCSCRMRVSPDPTSMDTNHKKGSRGWPRYFELLDACSTPPISVHMNLLSVSIE